jgi:hypothetical protein
VRFVHRRKSRAEALSGDNRRRGEDYCRRHNGLRLMQWTSLRRSARP